MKILKGLMKLVEMTDFFNSTQMLRYQNQNQYRTFTGGVLSLGIIVTIVIAFASMILDTLNLSTISYTQNVITRTDPSLTTITTSPDANFMFGIEIWHQNLSSPVRYFDVLLQLYVENAGINTPVPVDLVPCTREHWASMPDLVGNFEKLQVGGWLCPAIGSQYDIRGKYTSDLYQQLVFTVAPCNNATDPSRPCASPDEITQLFAENNDWFYFTFYYINTIINPDQPAYKSNYLEDTAYVIFSPQMGVESYLYFSDFKIETDYSIWPFSATLDDDGFMALTRPTTYPYAISALNHANYVTFAVAKSPSSIFFARQVQKLSTVFSFMGGLIGAIMAGLFIINSYTSFAFQISIARSIFRPEKKQGEGKQEQGQGEGEGGKQMVNFMQFIQYYWYALVKYLAKQYSDCRLQHVYECRQQILRQLDVKSLIKRLVFLEYSMTFIFTDYQLEGLQTHKPTTPHDIKAVRKRIENVDLADFESSFSQDDARPMDDLIEPNTAFNLSEFLKSSKVANLHSPAAHPTECREMVVVESVSEVSVHEQGRKVQMEKKRTLRMKNLMESAKEGNELSQRIWETMHTIKDDPPR